MGEQDEAHGMLVPGRVASRLVEAFAAGVAQAVPGRHGLSVHLGEPEAQPAALERHGREVAMEGLELGGEGGRGVFPARGVQPEERGHVVLKPGGVAEAEGQLVALGQLALAAPHLVAEVLALGGEELVPALPADRQRGARLGEEDGGARHLGPAGGTAEAVSDQQVGAPAPVGQHASEHARDPVAHRPRRTGGRAGRRGRGLRSGAPAADACGSGRAGAAPPSSPRDPCRRSAGARARRRSAPTTPAPSHRWRRRSPRPPPGGSSPPRGTPIRRGARTSARPWLLYR